LDGTLIARRRPRSHDESPPWMAMAMLGDGEVQYETDRSRFLGRNRGPAEPRALSNRAALSGTVGSVLDPVFALRRSTAVAPGQTATWDLLLSAGADRNAALAALTKGGSGSRGTYLAGAARHEQELSAALRIDPATAEAYQELAGALLYGHPSLRCDAGVIE